MSDGTACRRSRQWRGGYLAPAIVGLALIRCWRSRALPAGQSRAHARGPRVPHVAAVDGRASLTQGADAAALRLASGIAQGRRCNPAMGRVPAAVRSRCPASRSRSLVGRGATRRAARADATCPCAAFFPDPTRESRPRPRCGLRRLRRHGAPSSATTTTRASTFGARRCWSSITSRRKTIRDSALHGTGLTLHADIWTKTWNAQQHGAAALWW